MDEKKQENLFEEDFMTVDAKIFYVNVNPYRSEEDQAEIRKIAEKMGSTASYSDGDFQEPPYMTCYVVEYEADLLATALHARPTKPLYQDLVRFMEQKRSSNDSDPFPANN